MCVHFHVVSVSTCVCSVHICVCANTVYMHTHHACTVYMHGVCLQVFILHHWCASSVATHIHVHMSLSSGRYRGTRDAFRSILREGGIVGLWKGWAPNCQRAALVCLGGKMGLGKRVAT